MSILTDRQIAELCTPPNFVITKAVQYHNSPEKSFYLPKEEEIFSRLTEAEIKAVLAMKMGITTYRPLTQEEKDNYPCMITPFLPQQVKVDEGGNRILSKGLSSAGYDVSLTKDFRIFTNINTTLIDPLAFDDKCLHHHHGDYAIIPPNSYLLGTTVEHFNIPEDVMVMCVGKSTLARCGAVVNVTPIEPGFRGNIVIEIANASPSPLKVYANMGIAQFLFFRASEPCEVSYATRGGKYQNQTGVQLAIV